MKLHNSFLKGKMNKDFDKRILPKDEYTDALNIEISTATDGNAGVVKPSLGTTLVQDYLLTNAYAIGSVVDNSNNLLYYLVTSDEYDLIIEYNKSTDTSIKVLEDTKGRVLNFNKDYKVTGINIINTGDHSLRQLAWTDNLNSPKKIYIDTAKSYGLDGFTEEDITVIKAPPKEEPSVALVADPTLERNFIQNRLFTFAYRYIYEGNEVSSFSFFSDTVKLSVDNDEVESNLNAIDITVATGNSSVKEIEILFKEVNSSTVYLATRLVKAGYEFTTDTIGNTTIITIDDDTTYTHRFTNDTYYTVISDSDTSLLYSNVPTKAKDQDVIGNRLMYFNYEEGFEMKYDFFGESPLLTQSGNIIPNFSAEAIYEQLPVATQLDFELDDETGASTGLFSSMYIDFASNTITVGQVIELSFSTYIVDTNTGAGVFARHLLKYTSPDNYVSLAELYSGGFSEWLTESLLNIGLASTVSIVDGADPTYPNNLKINLTRYTFPIDELFLFYVSISAAESLTYKSDYRQEFGIVYYDKYNRSSTVLKSSEAVIKFPSIKTGRTNEEIGKVQLTITHNPPYWADRYKIVRKQNNYVYEVSDRTTLLVFLEDIDYYYLDINPDDVDKYIPNSEVDIRLQFTSATTINYPTTDVKFTVVEVGTKADLLSGITDTTMVDNDTVVRLKLKQGDLNGLDITTPSSNVSYWKNLFLYIDKTYTQPQDIYYEIPTTYYIQDGYHLGNGGTDQNQGWGIVIDNIDPELVVYGQVPAIITLDDGDAYMQGLPIEMHRLNSDFNSEKFYNVEQLRPNAFDPNYGVKKRFASICYSDVFTEETSFNGLNIFNVSLGNFKDLDKEHGSIQRGIGRYGDIFIAQEDKLSIIFFGKDLIANAEGNETLITSTQVLGGQRYIPIDNGISTDPHTLVRYDNWIILTDATRGEILLIQGEQVNKISKVFLQQYLKDLFRDNLSEYKLGGYNPRTNEYLVTINNQTLGFNVGEEGGWSTRYSFVPENYNLLNGNMYSFKDGVLYCHNNEDNLCNFYGTTYPISITTIFNESPYEIKEHLNFQLNSSHPFDLYAKSYTAGDFESVSTTVKSEEFVKKEGVWFAYARRNEDNSLLSKAAYGVGKVTNNTATYIEVTSLNSMVTVGDVLHSTSGSYSTITSLLNNRIYLTDTTGFDVDNYVYGKKNNRIEGGNLRGYVTEVKLELLPNQNIELFSVGTEAIKSYQ